MRTSGVKRQINSRLKTQVLQIRFILINFFTLLLLPLLYVFDVILHSHHSIIFLRQLCLQLHEKLSDLYQLVHMLIFGFEDVLCQTFFFYGMYVDFVETLGQDCLVSWLSFLNAHLEDEVSWFTFVLCFVTIDHSTEVPTNQCLHHDDLFLRKLRNQSLKRPTIYRKLRTWNVDLWNLDISVIMLLIIPLYTYVLPFINWIDLLFLFGVSIDCRHNDAWLHICPVWFMLCHGFWNIREILLCYKWKLILTSATLLFGGRPYSWWTFYRAFIKSDIFVD